MTAKTTKTANKTAAKAKDSGVRTYQHDMGHAEGYFREETIEMPSLTSDFIVVDKGITCKIDAGKVMAVRIMRPDGIMSWKKLFFPRGGNITGPIQMVDLGGMSDAEMTAKAQHAQGAKCFNDSTLSMALYLALYCVTLMVVGLREMLIQGAGNTGGYTVGHMVFSMVFALVAFMAGSYAFGRTKDVDLTETKSSQWLTKTPNET